MSNTLYGVSTFNMLPGNFSMSLLTADSSVVLRTLTAADLEIRLTSTLPTSSILSFNPRPMARIAAVVFESLNGLSNPATPIRNPSKPSVLPLTVITGALAYALATLRFRSRTITLAQISSSMLSHLSRTSCMWS